MDDWAGNWRKRREEGGREGEIGEKEGRKRRKEGYMDGRMDGWMDERLVGWVDEWMTR